MEKLAQHITNVAPIPEDGLAVVLEQFEERFFPKKAHVLRTGRQVREVYFIVSGCVRTYVHDLNGTEHNITFSTENWWFGDLQGFINATTASYNIQALEDTKVYAISKERWDFLIQVSPEFMAYTRVLFRNTLFTHENRILQNLSFTAQERYDHFLTQYPGLSQRISQKHIASYLGITPEFLSMIRSRRKG